MKIISLNSLIVKEPPCKAVFPFNPVVLPISNDGKLMKDGSAARLHYATVCYSITHNVFAIFEFGPHIYSALRGYLRRKKSLMKHEILLSRFDDGSLRINLGALNSSQFPTEDMIKAFAPLHAKLAEMYSSRVEPVKDKEEDK